MYKFKEAKVKRIISVLGLLFFLSNSLLAQFNTGTITLDGNNSESSYKTGGAYSVSWDNTYLYIRYSGGNADEPVIMHFDVNPINPVDGGANSNGSLTGQANWGITPTLPFRSDFMIYWESQYAEYRTANGSGGWSSATTITTSDRSNTGTASREIRLAWTWMGLSGRPTSFNWTAFANSRATPGYIFNSTPSENPTTALAAPTLNYYWNVGSTANDANITDPFSRKSFESRASLSLGTANTFWDFTVNGGTLTLAESFTINNQLYIASGTLIPSGVRTITFGSSSGNTPSLRCDGTLTPNNSSGNDLNIVGAYGTTTISGTASNTSFRFYNLTVNNGATIQAPSSGTVDLGWQFGTITVNSGGTLNFVNGSGVVNLTNSGSTSTAKIANSGSMTFNNITNNSGNTLQPATSPATSSINIKGNLSNSGILNTSNTGLLDITFNGSGAQSFPAATYQNLTIANTSATVTMGGNVTISSGKSLTVNTSAKLNVGTNVVSGSGSFVLSSGGTLVTAHTSGVNGSITTTTTTLNSVANYEFNGSSAQVTGAALTSANDLNVNNTAGLTLSSNTSITGTLTFNNGKLTTNGKTLSLTNTPSGSTTSRYIVTDATGTVTMNSVSSSKTLPIGTSSSYAPLVISAGTSTNYTAYVTSTLPCTPGDATKSINLAWGLSGSNVPSSITFQWNTGDQGGSFVSSGACEMGVYSSSCPYTVTGIGTATGTNPNTVSASTGFSTGSNIYVIGNTGAILSSVPTVTSTTTASSITNSTASSGGTGLTQGSSSITAKGVVWNTSTGPTVGTNLGITNQGSGTSDFTSSITGLSSQTLYYVRAYATNGTGTGYGNEIIFRTLSAPATAQSSSFTTTAGNTQLTVNWNTATWPGSGATQAGYLVIYSTSTPTLGSANGSAPSAGVGTLINITPTNLPTAPALTTTISSLTNGTTYNLLLIPYTWDGTNTSTYNYLTASALTTTGTPRTTPTVTTPTVSAITHNSATLGATVTSNGGATLTARGTSYKTSSPVAASDNQLAEGGTTVSAFTHSRTGLSSQTLYNYVGYATNAAGTGISAEGSFRTLSAPATAQPSSFTTTSGNAQLTVNWNTATWPGSGATQAGYLVIYSTSMPTLGSANGSAPSAGTGTLINITPTNLPAAPALTTTISSLTNGTTYNLLLIPYTWDGTNTSTYNYLTGSALTTSGVPNRITITSTSTGGTWSTGSSWVGGVAPTADNNVVIDTAATVTINSNVARNSGTTTIVRGVLATGATYTNNGTTTINGTFQINSGGFATGSDFTYGSNGTLSFQSGGSYGVTNDPPRYWPNSSGPVNVTVGGIVSGSGLDFGNNGNVLTRTVSGLFQTSGPVSITSNVGTSVLTLSGTCKINAGGFFNQAPTYSGTATLIYNTGGSYNTFFEWNSSSSTVGLGVPNHVTVQGGTTLTIGAARALTGTLTVSSNSKLLLTNGYTSGSMNVDGTLQINNNGYTSVAPVYGSSSLLLYNSGNIFGRGLEWSSTSGAGYPANVQIGDGTTTTTLNIGNGGTGTSRQCSGNLTVSTNSTFSMNEGGSVMTQPVTISGNVVNYGTITLSSQFGGDIKVNGNWQDNGTFNANTRAVFFTGTGLQTISGTASAPFNIDYIVVNKTSGSVRMDVDLLVGAPSTGNAITLSNATDTLDLNGKVLTIGTASVANTFSGNGVFKGGGNSSLIINGTGALGTIRFDQTSDGTSNLIKDFTINRTSSGTVTLGNKLVSGTSLTLTNGNLVLNNQTLQLNGSFSGSAANSLTGGSSSTATVSIGGSGSFGTLYFNQTTDGTTNLIGNLVVNRSGQTITLGNKVILGGDFSITSGTVDIGANTANRNASGGTLTVAGTLRLSGSSGGASGSNFPSNFTTQTMTGGTVEYYGATQTIANGPVYNHLTLTTSGTRTLGGATTVNGVLTIASGVTLNAESNTINLAGSGTPFVISGTFDAGSSTVNYTNASATNITAGNYFNLNGTGGNRTLPNGSVVGVAGGFTPGSGTYTIAGSTVDFNGTAAQTIPAFNFNHLTVSGNKNNGSITLASGTIGVAGNFNVSGASNISSYVTTGNTVDFNGVSSQTIPAFNFNHLTISGNKNNGSITLSSGTIGVAGDFTTSGVSNIASYVITGNTVDFNGTAAQSIGAFNFNHLTISGNKNGNAITLAPGTIGIAGNFTFSGASNVSAYIVSGNTVDFNGSASQSIPAFNFNDLTISGNKGGGTVTLVNGGTIGVAGSMTVTATNSNYTIAGNTVAFNGTGSQSVPAFQFNNLSITGSKSGNVTISSSGTIGIAGTFTPSATFTSGSYVVTGSTLNFNAASGSQTIPSTFTYHHLTVSGGGSRTVSGTGSTLTVNSNLAIQDALVLDMGDNALAGVVTTSTNSSGSLYTQNAGTTALPDGLTWNFNVAYNGTAAQTVNHGNYNGGLVLNNSNGATLKGSTSAATLTLTAGDLSIASNTLTLNGAFTRSGSNSLKGSATSNLSVGDNASAGTLYFKNDGSTGNYLKNFTVGSAASTTLGNRLHLTAGAAAGVLTVRNNSSLSTGDNLVLKSDANGTARVAEITGCTSCTPITGEVEVERFIPAKRTWRLITLPVTGSYTLRQQLTRQSFNEEPNPYPDPWCIGSPTPASTGYGTMITGFSMSSCANSTSAGADWLQFGGGSSVRRYTYVNGVGSWGNTITNTPNFLAPPAEEGYLVFVRGDRSKLNTDTGSTTFRFKGTLKQGNKSATIGAKYGTMSNPYASPIDLDHMYQNASGNSSNFERNFWIWDGDKQVGATGLGGYVAVSYDGNGGYDCGACQQGNQVGDYLTVNSGQAFMVQRKTDGNDTLTGTGVLNIQENNKYSSVGNIMTIRTAGRSQRLMGTQPKFRVQLYKATAGNLEEFSDGALVRFDNDYQAGTKEPYDIYKYNNFAENLSLVRTNAYLEIESRPLPTASDTIYLPFWNSTVRDYALKILPENLVAANLTAELIDNFTNTRTTIPLTAPEFIYPFSVTSAAASKDLGRFRVVFTPLPSTPLPVTFTKIRAYAKAEGVQVEWDTEYEDNLEIYEVEYSTDGRNFVKKGQKVPGNSGNRASYNWLDVQPVSGANFYRIKAIDKDGTFRFSSIVQLKRGLDVTGITVAPTVVTDKTVTLIIANQPAGSYSVRLVNTMGQEVMRQQLVHPGGSASQTIKLNSGIVHSGMYYLSVYNDQGLQKTIKIEIQ